MPNLEQNRRIVLFTIAIVVIAGIGVGMWKLLGALFFEPNKQEKILESTGSETPYKADIFIGGDPFSGYAPLREAMNTLRSRGIRAHWVDDGADYNVRIQRLKEKKIGFAVFDISSLIKASANIGELPGTILFVIDESFGADGVVAYKNTYPTLSAINSPDTRVVLVPDSPSETFIRSAMADMNLSRLSSSWVRMSNQKEVYDRFMSGEGKQEVYVLWEPYLSMALQHPSAVLLTDTSKRRGIIVYILVVNREYLLDNTSLVAEVVEHYFTTLYSLNTSGRLTTLLVEDASNWGEKITPEQAATIAKKVSWRNTVENFAHFGLTSASGLLHIEDMCSGVMRVLLETGSIAKDPTNGKPSLLYYRSVLQQMQSAGFHPGKEEITTTTNLAALSDEEWEKLSAIAEMKVPPLEFSRGRARLTPESEQALTSLALRLADWPSYYLEVTGETLPGGDEEANRKLAQLRAQAVRDYLISRKVAESRIRATATSGTGSASVRFVVKLKPY